MEYLIQFIYSFFATFTFGIILQSPKKALVANGVIGAIGWVVYMYLLNTYNQTILSSLLSSIIIGTLSAITAIVMKIPTITMYLPSLIPIVPGGGMYYTMYYFILQNMELFSQKGVETILIAISLATGTFVSTTVVNILNRAFSTKAIKSTKLHH